MNVISDLLIVPKALKDHDHFTFEPISFLTMFPANNADFAGEAALPVKYAH